MYRSKSGNRQRSKCPVPVMAGVKGSCDCQGSKRRICFFTMMWNGTLADFWSCVCFTARGRGNRRANSSNTQSVSLTVDYSVYLTIAVILEQQLLCLFICDWCTHAWYFMLFFSCSLLGGLTMWWGLVLERKGMFFKSRLVSPTLKRRAFKRRFFYIVAPLVECSLLLFFQSLKCLCFLGAAALWSAT